MVIGYLRVSTAQQNSENQKDEITRYAKQKDLTINTWFVDTTSGKTNWKKRNLGKAMKKLQKGDTLIVTEISRLSRSLHEIMNIMQHCVDNSITVYSTKDGYAFDDSVNSKVLSFAFGLAAEIEHKLISQRTREALTHVKAQGKVLGRRKGSGEKMNKLIANKSEVIKQLRSGNTLGSICKKFKISYRTLYRFRDLDDDIARIMNERGDDKIDK